MIHIEQMRDIDPDQAHALSRGYTSDLRYVASKTETHAETTIRLTLEPAPEPVSVEWPMGEWDRRTWHECVATGLALGAWDEDKLVGMCLGSTQDWNRTLWIWELRIDSAHRRQGIGSRLLDRAAEWGRREGMRTMLVEVQSDNVPAIAFYRRVGFAVEAIDLSYYSNRDTEPGKHIALFMKRRLD